MRNSAVIPSYLSAEPRGVIKGFGDDLNDTKLMLGEVKAIIYPTEDLSFSKSSVEYEVLVEARQGLGSVANTLFRGVTVNSVFGGIADKFTYTLRPDAKKESKEVGVGSKVLLLCINGNRQRAIILGGIKDPAEEFKDKDEGHNLFFEFNGIQFTINKDGEAKLTFIGATQASGEISENASKDASGSFFSVEKDGSWTLATPTSDQQVHLNHTDKSIEVVARDQFFLECGGTTNIEASGRTEIRSRDSNINMHAGQFVDIQSSGVHVGTATDAWVKGTTYRAQQTIMHTQMQSMMAALSGLISTAGASLATAAGLHVVPVVGSTLGAPAVASAAAALTAAGPILAALSSAIAAFEAQGVTYLSTKNLTD